MTESRFNPDHWYQCDRCLSHTLGFDLNIHPRCQGCGASDEYLSKLSHSATCHCYQCGQLHFVHSMTHIDNHFYCESCANSMPRCAQCGEYILNWPYSYTVHTTTATVEICPDCIGNLSVYECLYCSDLYTEEAVENLDSVYDRFVCPHCNENATPAIIHPYSYKPPTNWLGTPHTIKYGVELELSMPDLSTTIHLRDRYSSDEKLWYWKADCSIGDHDDDPLGQGAELVTHPATLRYHHDHFPWEPLLLDADANGCDGTYNGLHVHASIKYLTMPERIRLGIFINNCEPYVELVAGRNSYEWARYKSVTWDDVSAMGFEGARYEALNWGNRYTVEFRIFRGTTDPDILYSCIEFVDASIHFIKDTPTPILRHLDTAWKLFCEFVDEHKQTYFHLRDHMSTVGAWILK